MVERLPNSEKIAVVIRTLNEIALFPAVLKEIQNQSIQPSEIIVVDSGSTDGTVEAAQLGGATRILRIAKSEFTYGRALNIGIDAASPRVEWAVILSAHSLPVRRYWLEHLLHPFGTNPAIAGVYGKQLPHPSHLNKPVVRVLAADSYPRYYGDHPILTDSDFFFSNANSAIRIDAWKRHAFDEKMTVSEDHEWARWHQADGRLIAYSPEAAVYHSHPDSWPRYYRRRLAETTALARWNPNPEAPYSARELRKELRRIARRLFALYRKGRPDPLERDRMFMRATLALARFYGGRRAAKAI